MTLVSFQGIFYSTISDEEIQSSEEELVPCSPHLYFFTSRKTETNSTNEQPGRILLMYIIYCWGFSVQGGKKKHLRRL